MSCIVCGDLGEYGDELRRRMQEKCSGTIIGDSEREQEHATKSD